MFIFSLLIIFTRLITYLIIFTFWFSIFTWTLLYTNFFFNIFIWYIINSYSITSIILCTYFILIFIYICIFITTWYTFISSSKITNKVISCSSTVIISNTLFSRFINLIIVTSIITCIILFTNWISISISTSTYASIFLWIIKWYLWTITYTLISS